MTVARIPHPHGAEVDALVADRYLDGLLASAGRGADDAPADASLSPELREATRVLRRSLVRLHPSFRFEERLAASLAELAAAQARTPAQGTGGGAAEIGAVIPFARPGTNPVEPDPLLGAILAGELDPADTAASERESRPPAARRPLLVGGAIASAAISIVGVAWVGWRATRPAAIAGLAGRELAGRELVAGGELGGPA